MFTKLLSAPAIFLFIFLFQTNPGAGQETIRFKPQRASSEQHLLLKEQFKAYTLATLGTEEVSSVLKSKDYFSSLRMEINDQSYTFNLRARDLRAPNYKLRAMTETGEVDLPRSPNKTYYGFTHEGQYDVRITSDEDFFYGMILLGDDELYIEPARHIIPGAPINQFVIYLASDNLKKFKPNSCGVHDAQTPFSNPEEDHDHAPDQAFSGRACKVIQIALADDVQMFNQYGSVGAVEDHNMAVINNVGMNFDDEFNDDLQFSVVEIYVATTAGNDPWTESTDPGLLLDDFTAWGPSGFDNVHDVASLWTNRNFDGDVIGLAWVATVCTNFKYNVLEDFSTNANFLRVLQAHELGHNFSANHDAQGSTTIMAPTVQNTSTWSTASVNAINTYINGISCLAPCGGSQPPVANFSGTPTSGCAPLTVSFDDMSTNTPTSWNWTFEGGSPPTSTNQNPTVTFNNPGSYNVSLMVSNSQGSNSVTFFDYITVGEPPFADFDYSIDELTVDFVNQSDNSTSYFWTFGDGGTSNVANPIHMYDEDGVYTVTLTSTNSCGSDIFTQVIEIITLPAAAFSSDVTEGCDPFEVEFINLSSQNADFYSWSFPGGSPPTSSNFEPTVLYEIPGSYNVSLTVYNEAGEDITTITNYITVLPQPTAEFNFTTNGLQVNFSSLGSEGDSFFWNFGDGHVSILENPTHTYDASGTYQVSLTVSNECGSDVLVLNVAVTGAPEAAFSSNTQYGCAPLVVQYTNQSGGNPTSFNWLFEGGSPMTSNLPNPVVTYTTPGTYDVTLTVTNGAGSDILVETNYIEIEYPTVSDFDYSINGLVASFTNQSFNATGSTWFFGDGIVSDDTHPVHMYAEDGVYTVTLISLGICGNDTSTAQIIIQTPPQADFTFNQLSACTPATVIFSNESSSNATSFLWTFPGGNPSSSTDENPSVIYNAPGIYDVTLIAYSGGGSDTMTWSDFISIGEAPSAAFLLGTDVLTVTFDNQSMGADSYLWLFGDGQSSTDAEPVHTYGSFGTYAISLIASNECGNDTMEVVIELSTVPNAFFSYSAHSGCAPFEVQFIDQSQNNPTIWEWTFEGGTPPTSNVQNPTVLYAVPGTYSVSLRVENPQGTDVLILDGLIDVGGIPDATFNHVQNENVIALEYPGTDYDSLRWTFGDGRSDNSLNPTVEYNTPGQYQISLIVYNQCGTDTASIWVTITITGTTDPDDLAAGWQIRPNPFSNVLTIYGKPDTEGSVRISLLDMHGRMMMTEDWLHPAGEATKEIPGDRLPSGVILVLIQDQLSRIILKAVHQP